MNKSPAPGGKSHSPAPAGTTAPAGPPAGRWLAAAAAARILVGLVFVASGFPKAVAPAGEFAAVIEAYYIPGLGEAAVHRIATVLPWVELLVGAWLAAGYRTRLSGGAALALLASFLVVLGSAILRGVPLEHCGCFGAALPFTPGQAVAFDLFLAACATLALRRGAERASLDRWVEAGAPS